MKPTTALLFMTSLVLVTGCRGGRPIPGDAAHFDPLATLPALRANLEEGYRLQWFNASGVRPDGTIDLTDRRVEGGATYAFARRVPAPPDPPPVGAGGSLDGSWHQVAIVLVERPGSHVVSNTATETVYRSSRGILVMEHEPSAGEPDPVGVDPWCSAAELFRLAVERGVPVQDVVASIGYFAGTDPHYTMTVEGTDLAFTFDADCRLNRDPDA